MLTDGQRAKGNAADIVLLRQSWQDWANIGATLSDEDWTQPTRLTGWTVRTLYAHVARSVGVLADALRTSSASQPERSSASAYFAAFRDIRAEAARSVDAAARQAAATEPARLVTSLAEDGPPVLDLAEAAGPATITTVAGTIAVPDYLLTRLVEATVHLLDLRHAIPGPAPDPAAVDRVADVLVGIAGPAAFIDAATGRADLSIFPLLA